MGNYAWLTDIHLDAIDDNRLMRLVEDIKATRPDGVIISGDVSNARQVVYHLSALERGVQLPIYFVLGNHDYYGGSIETVRKSMKDLARLSPYLKYLPNSGYEMLNESTAIVGHDCWYDANWGDAKGSSMILNDWHLIHEYRQFAGPSMYGRGDSRPSRQKTIEISQQLAREGVVHLQDSIKKAMRYARNVVVVSHVPPFRESHIYNGKIGDNNAHPWFTCKMLGDMLTDAAKAFPDRNIISLSGHTHGRYQGKFANNLEVFVGEAAYSNPKVERNFQL
jgi:predicted MPP superfamily phosphohydrolase